MLAWALKAAENNGRDAGELIASASDAADIVFRDALVGHVRVTLGGHDG